jgi:hypothetical protein
MMCLVAFFQELMSVCLSECPSMVHLPSHYTLQNARVLQSEVVVSAPAHVAWPCQSTAGWESAGAAKPAQHLAALAQSLMELASLAA